MNLGLNISYFFLGKTKLMIYMDSQIGKEIGDRRIVKIVFSLQKNWCGGSRYSVIASY